MTEEPKIEFNTIPSNNPDIALRGARIFAGKGYVSIQPESPDSNGDLALALVDEKGHVYDEPIRLDANQGDLEEAADMIARYLATGHTPREILEQLHKDQDNANKSIFDEWRKRFSR